MILIELLGYTAGILTLVNMLPQIIRTDRTKHAKDISYLMIITYSLSMLFWVIYAYFINSWPIIITNGIAFILSLVQIFLMNKYNKKNDYRIPVIH
jgi:MtN3 and saliva related transmembrane protein